MDEAIRSSRMAGTWYPAEPGVLRALLEGSVAEAEACDVTGRLRALVVPHAGIRYSGRIAAAAYRLLERKRFDSVLLLGPCHQGGDGLFLIQGGGIETPLGVVRIDRDLVAALERSSSRIRFAPEVHLDEHSLEMQYPFLQYFLPGVPVAPMLMGYQTPSVIAVAIHAIESAVKQSGRSVLLVASSDLSHFEPRTRARELDSEVVACLERFDPRGLAELLGARRDHACGGGPMVAVLEAARTLGASQSRVLAYGDSGDVTGDMAGVVGYASAAFMECHGEVGPGPS